jgi:hypothetical protein
VTLQDDINAAITEAFINENPVSISLRRFAKITTASGGYTKGTETVLAAQTMTKINPSFRGQILEITNEDGHVIVPDFALVAAVDADIQRNDRFVLEGNTYKVEMVDESRDDWAKRAYITRWKV